MSESSKSIKRNILIISLPKGSYRLTVCQDCHTKVRCSNCDYNMTAIVTEVKNSDQVRMPYTLHCSECQNSQPYPKNCNTCGSNNITSNYGGRDLLASKIDSMSDTFLKTNTITTSNRIFDPSVDYTEYNKIIITHSENLFLGIDYTSVENNAKSLTELLYCCNQNTDIVFDTLEFDENEKSNILDGIANPLEWYNNIIKVEREQREMFLFPPYYNITLISTSEKTREIAKNKLLTVRSQLQQYYADNGLKLPTILPPYNSQILKKRGLYTMHLQVKFPKNYVKISELQSVIAQLKANYRLTIRVNPRHTM